MKLRFPPMPPRSASAATRPAAVIALQNGAFTLVEMLVVMAVILALLTIVTPAINALKSSGDVTSSAYDLSDALERARAYAMASNTYVWVGIFEEDGSRNSTIPATAGTGRLVISTIYSKDGTCLYDPTGVVAGFPSHTTLLAPYGRLLKIDYTHLTAFLNGTGAGGGFAGRPPAGNMSDGTDATSRISDKLPAANSNYPFTYPLGATGNTLQYTFEKMIQFSPRGESRIDCIEPIQPVIEIGLMHSHGAVADTLSKNVVAQQLSGIAGNVRICRE